MIGFHGEIGLERLHLLRLCGSAASEIRFLDFVFDFTFKDLCGLHEVRSE